MGVLRHYMQNWAGVNGVIGFIRVSGPSPNVQSMISASTLPLQGPPARQGLSSSVSQLLQGRSFAMLVDVQRYGKVHPVPTI